MGVLVNSVINRECQHSEYQTNCRNDGYYFAFRGLTRRSIDLGLADNLERSLIEVAAFVRVRIEEEALRATFHCRDFQD